MAKVTLVFAVLLIALGLVGYLGHRQRASHGADSHLVRPGAGRLWLSGHQPQRGPAQAVHAHQCDHRAAGLSGRGDRGCAAVMLQPASAGLAPDQIALASKLTMAGLTADLRDSLRALVHRRAAFGKGVALGNHAWRDGHGHARRAFAARARSAGRPGGAAQAKAQAEKDLAAGPRADGAAHRSAAGRHGA